MEDQIRYYKNKLEFEIDSFDLAEGINKGERFLVVDTRAKGSFDREHIAGALSLPWRSMNEATAQALDRTSVIVTYCNGIGCNASTKGALILAQLGFKVKELTGGISWWKRGGYSTEGVSATTATSAVECDC